MRRLLTFLIVLFSVGTVLAVDNFIDDTNSILGTSKVAHATTTIKYDGYEMAWGRILDSLIIADSATAARDSTTVVIMGPIGIAQFANLQAWVFAPTLDDSVCALSDLDTTRIVFQTSPDRSNWFDVRAVTYDTVLIATTTIAQISGLSAATSTTDRHFHKWFRILVHYDLTIGDQGGAGTRDTLISEYEYGYRASR